MRRKVWDIETKALIRNGGDVDGVTHPDLVRLSMTGHARTERGLRKVYDEGDSDACEQVLRLVRQWESPRALRLTDEWVAEGVRHGLFNSVTAVWFWKGWQTFERFKVILEDRDARWEMTDAAADHFADVLDFQSRRRRYNEGLELIARHLKHPSGEVRWTVCFSLAKLGARAYLVGIRGLAGDTTLTVYGQVSAIAERAARRLTGEKLDLHGN